LRATLKTVKDTIMKIKYRVVVHNFENKRFVNEYYKLDANRSVLSVVIDDNEIQKIFKTSEKDVIELYHHNDYEKVYSKNLDMYLYGAYVNISNRIPDEINRF